MPLTWRNHSAAVSQTITLMILLLRTIGQGADATSAARRSSFHCTTALTKCGAATVNELSD